MSTQAPGALVVDAEQARFYSEQPEASAQYEPGQHVRLRACVPDWELELIQQRDGRPCPRVDLEPENVDASTLAVLALSQYAALFQPYWDAATEELLPRERVALLDRVLSALDTPALTKPQEDAVARVLAAYAKR